MINPGYVALAADRRTPFTATLRLKGVDLTDAVLAAQVRLYPDAAGDPLINLAQVGTSSAEGVRIIYAGTDTVTNHIAAGRLQSVPTGMATGDSMVLTLLGIRVNETTMEGLPESSPPGRDVTLAWDAHITPSGGLKGKWFAGPFIVRAGVTR